MDKFKDSNHRWLLRALFHEYRHESGYPGIYTLRGYDLSESQPSLKRLYIEMGDDGEYDFANKYLGGWDHWLALCRTNWFKEHLAVWRAELQAKLQGKAIAILKQKAEAGDINAAKFIYSLSTKKDQGRGRPKKPTQTEVVDTTVIAEDLARLQSINERIN